MSPSQTETQLGGHLQSRRGLEENRKRGQGATERSQRRLGRASPVEIHYSERCADICLCLMTQARPSQCPSLSLFPCFTLTWAVRVVIINLNCWLLLIFSVGHMCSLFISFRNEGYGFMSSFYGENYRIYLSYSYKCYSCYELFQIFIREFCKISNKYFWLLAVIKCHLLFITECLNIQHSKCLNRVKEYSF